jgi:multidrug efflux pump
MNKLIHTAITRSRTMLLLLGLIVMAGTYSYVTIPKESNPDIPLPYIYVSVTHDGISPEDSVNLLIKPLEQELKSIEGLDEMEATAYEGGANLFLKFIAGMDVDQALTDVRNQIDIAKKELPEESEEPTVTEMNISTSFPILTVILGGNIPERILKETADDLAEKFEGVEGVLEAKVTGTREEQVLVEVDRTQLESYDVPPGAMLAAFRENNQLVAAGSIELSNGKYAIKVPGLFKSLPEIMNLPLITDGEQTIKVKDVASVRLNFKDYTNKTRVNDESAVTIEITKRTGENIIELVDNVKHITQEESEHWVEGISYSYTSDESSNIRTMLNDLQNSVMLAILLVMIVILAALGTHSALLVAISIPGSFLMAITLVYTLGFTVNVVVLFALILSVGMLVDGAIVVTELAEKRLNEGFKRVDAFKEAASYMAWPIIASTATTLAAFSPLVFWPGIMGEFMKFLPLTLIFVLGSSLIMALLFLPMIGSLTAPARKNRAIKKTSYFDVITERYTHFLEKALKMPKKILLYSAGGWILSIVLYIILGQGVQFFPEIEPDRGNIIVHSSGDYSLEEKDKVIGEISKLLVGIENVHTLYATTGSNSNTHSEDTIGTIFMELVPWKERTKKTQAVFDEAIARVNHIPGVSIELEKQKEGPPGGKPIKLIVSADNYRYIPPVVQKIQQMLENFEGTINVTNTLPLPGIEWAMKIDREEATKAKANIDQVGQVIRLTTAGVKIGKYRPEEKDEEIDIIARFPEKERTFSTLDSLTLTTEGGHMPISHFVEKTPKQKVTTIKRLDQQNAIYVESDIKEGFLADTIVRAIKKEIKDVALPPGVEIAFKGEDKDQREAQEFLKKAFSVALLLMAIILVTQFNNFYQALIILSAVVLSTSGVLLGHIITLKPFGIVMSGLGVIALAGIVVNNNIVLIDTFNKHIKQPNTPWRKALIDTGRARLRPVLLTAITTIIGLFPMAAKINVNILGRQMQYNAPATQWWDQLASSIIFGLAFATVLTLIITPCMIALPYVRKEKREAK